MEQTKSQNRTNLKIARMQTDAQKEVARIQSEPAHRQAGVAEQSMPARIALDIASSNQKIASLAVLAAEASKTGQQARYEKLRADLGRELIGAEIHQRLYGTKTSAIVSGGKAVVTEAADGLVESAADWLSGADEWMQSNVYGPIGMFQSGTEKHQEKAKSFQKSISQRAMEKRGPKPRGKGY